MLPSRGIHALRAKIPRQSLAQQCRHLSSTPRPHIRSAILRSQPQSIPWTRRTAATPISALSLLSIRHASTETENYVPPPSEFPNLDTINLDTINLDALPTGPVEEPIGYLHSLGIDYGYGPTSMIQFVLEHIHVYTGMPWWASILSTAFLLRLAMFPLFLKSSDSMARQAALGSVLKPYVEKMKEAQKAGDTQAVLFAMNQRSAINKKAGISTTAQFFPLILQGVTGFCGFRLMNAMVALPVPGLHNGGFLWLMDLTLTDGYLLLPLFMAGTMHMVTRYGGETGTAALPPQMKNVMLYVMPVFIGLFTAWQPGAVCLWFCGSGAIGLAQGQLLQRKSVRQFFGLAPLYKPPPGEEVLNPLMAMFEKKKDATATARGTGRAATGAAQYKNLQWQAPNLQRTPGRTIDAQVVTKNGTPSADPDMVQPAKKGILGGIKGAIKDSQESVKSFKSKVQEQLAQSEEKKKEAAAKAFKARAHAYEKRARERGR